MYCRLWRPNLQMGWGWDLGGGPWCPKDGEQGFDMHSSPMLAVSPDVYQQLVPPRFLERFTSKKVKKGSSITFSVKVEGGALLLS